MNDFVLHNFEQFRTSKYPTQMCASNLSIHMLYTLLSYRHRTNNTYNTLNTTTSSLFSFFLNK